MARGEDCLNHGLHGLKDFTEWEGLWAVREVDGKTGGLEGWKDGRGEDGKTSGREEEGEGIV